MVRHNFLDRYAGLDSPLHLLEARSKLLAFTALIVSVLCIPAGRGSLFFVYFFAAAVLMGISQVPLNYIVGRTLLILPFIVLAGLAVPWDGYTGLGILLIRAVLFLILLILLTNTTRFVELLRGLRRLGFPQVITTKLSFLYHNSFVLAEEAMRMKQARGCRRVGRSRFGYELKILSSMPKTLLLRSFERAERMHSAMLSRAFGGDFPVVAPRKFSLQDVAFLCAVGLFISSTFLIL